MYDSKFKPEPKKLIMLRGIPGSGKSTWIEKRNLEKYTLSSDRLRLMFSNPNPYISQENNQRVWEIFNEMLISRMKVGDFTILDATHTDKKSIKKHEQLCSQYGYLLIIVDFKITLDEALERNKTRPEYQKVPEEVITKMYNNLINSEEKSL
jgi:2',3'-cyclic-nucleotide 3'-phosphodiesterase